MRRAKALDWRRRLHEARGAWPLKVERFAFENVPSLGSGEVAISSPLTVLAGANGAGKTTLLRALWATLDPIASKEVVEHSRKLVSGTAIADLRQDEVALTRDVDFAAIADAEPAELKVIHVDAAIDALAQQAAFCGFDSAEDITNGAGARQLDAATIGQINYILNRNYRSITVYEVELKTAAPFFEVAYGDSLYDSRTMGAGEISALYIWWHLDRAESGSIILIEEPEAFLSHASQKHIINHIIYSLVDKSLWVVLSSHSAPIISDLPKDSVRFLTRAQGSIQISSEKPPPAVLDALGVEFKLIGIIFVEDELAALFAKALIERADAALMRRLHVEVRTGGESAVTSALKITSTIKGGIRFVGLYDGDQRKTPPTGLDEYYGFLPGDDPAEVMFRNMIENDRSALVSIYGKDQVDGILHAIEGRDHHDWYAELQNNLGLDRAQLFQLLFNGWYAKPENVEPSAETYKQICALFGVAN